MPSNVQQVLLGYGGGAPDASISFLQTNSDAVDRTTYTFAGESLGVADSARKIIVGFTGRRSTVVAAAISSVTIGGVSATIVHTQTSADTRTISGIAIAAVPTGTTGDVVVVFNGTSFRCGISVYRALNANSTYEDRQASTANPLTSNLTVTAGSIQVFVGESSGGTAASWTGTNAPTEDSDFTVESGQMSTASRASASALTVTGTCTFTSSSQPAYVSASFAKA